MGNPRSGHHCAPGLNPEPVLKSTSNHPSSVLLLYLPASGPTWLDSCLLGTPLWQATSFLCRARDTQTSASGLCSPLCIRCRYLRACSKALRRNRRSTLITEVRFVGVAHINANDYGFVGRRSRSQQLYTAEGMFAFFEAYFEIISEVYFNVGKMVFAAK